MPALAAAAHQAVVDEYVQLERAIVDPAVRSAGSQWSQPWMQ
jgi:hypothetical protein